jgi:ethanolamine ammonia-lyase large subunit
MPQSFVKSIPNAIAATTLSADKKDYVYHPETGEKLNKKTISQLKAIQSGWKSEIPDVQIIISDGLNAKALMDEDHLFPFLEELKNQLQKKGYTISPQNIVFTHGRVRAGYATGEQLFGNLQNPNEKKGIIHIIGERPGSGHHNFSAYITAATVGQWNKIGTVDHDISRVVSGISDTALLPEQAALDVSNILEGLFESRV